MADLSTNQRKALEALLIYSTIRDAADAAGLGETTVYRYLRDAGFKAELRQRQDEILAATTAALAGLSAAAVQALRDALALLGDQSVLSVGDFITVDDNGSWQLDLTAARDAGLLHLIRKLWIDKEGNSRLELHDPQTAAYRRGQLALNILNERRRSVELDDLAQRVADLETVLGGES